MQCQIKYPDALLVCPKDGSPFSSGAEHSPGDPYIGSTIDGRYLIESKLGEGGMGVVYAGRHVIIDKRVAIKVLRKEAQEEETAGQRFIQEAKSASKIGHANIVDITDYGVLPDGSAYFVMEFLEGQTLGKLISAGPMPSRRVITVAAQMARGLHSAHQKGIVHRDLKPENIFLLERDGQSDFVKIVDFGIAKVQAGFSGAPGAGQRLTQVGMVLGTPEYMSPEQATGKETDHRVDEYALGCMMYEMLTGDVPFRGDTSAGTLTKHVFDAVVPPSRKRPDLQISKMLEGVTLKSMAKKADDRYPSMRELLDALDAAGAEIDSGREAQRAAVRDASRASPTSMGARLSTEELSTLNGGRNRRVLMIVAGVVLVGGAGIAAAVVLGGAPPERPMVAVRSPAPPKRLVAPAVPAAPKDVKLTLRSNPEGAEVFLDGEDLGAAPVTFTHAIDSRPLSFLFKLAGHKDVTRDLVPTESRDVEISLLQTRHEGHAQKTHGEKGTPAAPSSDGAGSKTPVKTAGELRDPF